MYTTRCLKNGIYMGQCFCIVLLNLRYINQWYTGDNVSTIVPFSGRRFGDMLLKAASVVSHQVVVQIAVFFSMSDGFITSGQSKDVLKRRLSG